MQALCGKKRASTAALDDRDVGRRRNLERSCKRSYDDALGQKKIKGGGRWRRVARAIISLESLQWLVWSCVRGRCLLS